MNFYNIVHSEDRSKKIVIWRTELISFFPSVNIEEFAYILKKEFSDVPERDLELVIHSFLGGVILKRKKDSLVDFAECLKKLYGL